VASLAGFALLLALPSGEGGSDPPDRARGLARRLPAVAGAGGRRPGDRSFQFVTNLPWIASPAIRYHIGIDGISLWLVLLTTLLTPICVLVSCGQIDKAGERVLRALPAAGIRADRRFVALDLFVFYVFWEVSLVPMYFLIGIWGHERRSTRAVKFFLYTMAGSVLMLRASSTSTTAPEPSTTPC